MEEPEKLVLMARIFYLMFSSKYSAKDTMDAQFSHASKLLVPKPLRYQQQNKKLDATFWNKDLYWTDKVQKYCNIKRMK